MSPHSERPVTRLVLSASVGLALVLAAFTIVLSAGQVTAQESSPKPTHEQREACKADFLRLCPGVKPGAGRPMQCLQSHVAELSPPCGELVNAAIASQAAS